MSIKDNVETVNKKIPKKVTLVVAVKYATESEIREAYNAGIRHFGFNTYQQMDEIAPKLAHEKDAKLHFIGTLQSNKIRKLMALKPELIQTVDSEKQAILIDRIAQEQSRIQDILIQVNTDEKKDSGIPPENLTELIEIIMPLKNIRIRGLMTVPKDTEDKEELEQTFRSMRRLFDSIPKTHPGLEFDCLSMGMSSDYETAIREGSTMVRLGSIIFKAH